MLATFAAYVVVLLAGYGLRYLNLRHLREHGREIPRELAGEIDPDGLRKSAAYTLDQSQLALAESVWDNGLTLLFLFGGLIQLYEGCVQGVTGSFVWRGVLFFLGLHWAKALVGIPFDLYETFRVEARHGFNTTTPGLWISDFLKGQAVGSVLLAILTACALGLVRWSPNAWWVWVWAFFVLFSVVLLYLSPYVIEPLFFRFEPVREAGIEEEVRGLMEKAGLGVSRVFQVDASRRSKHSNAYFTGIGRVKRIVLFDTLLSQMTHGEILAVLAHEVGHWKRRHILKRLVTMAATSLLGLYAAHRLLGWGGLPSLLGLREASFYAQCMVLGLLYSIVLFPATPLFAALSRRHEREADAFAIDLTAAPEALASALVKLSRENLANLHPHPLYARFYWSHPPVVERIRALRSPRCEVVSGREAAPALREASP